MSEAETLLFNLVLVVLLLLTNAFFVASEFALVSVRRTRLTQLSNEGNHNAELALKAIDEINKYMAATQLGITIASIGIGWVGEASIVKLLMHLFSFIPNFTIRLVSAHTIAVAIAFLIITLMHVVMGELVPRAIALQHSEKTSLLRIRPLLFAKAIFKPFIWVLNGCGTFLLGLINVKPEEHHLSHSTEELNMLIDASYNDGVINETEKDMIQNVFKFSDLCAKQVMIPRTDVTCIPVDVSLDELKQITCETQYTRYPVYEDDLDNVIGILHIKDIYASVLKGEFDIRKLIRKPMMVPETVNVDKLLLDFKQQQNQMAIVIDEFGGTSGIITLEDVLEEIFGEVQDEFDDDEVEDLVKISENCYEVNPMMRTDEFSEVFNVHIEDEDVDTIGGFVIKQLGRLAENNDSVIYENLEFVVKEISKTRITKLCLNIIPPAVVEGEAQEE